MDALSITLIIGFILYLYACIVVSNHRCQRFSGAEAFFMALLFTPVTALLINILAEIQEYRQDNLQNRLKPCE